MTKRFYWGIRFPYGRNCTDGQPNQKTGRYSKAVVIECFETKQKLYEWIANETYHDKEVGERLHISKKNIRKYCLGESLYATNEYLNMLAMDYINKD